MTRSSIAPESGQWGRLPVFFDLGGRKAVVAGCASGAAWKAELLARAGARVEIYAPDPSPELSTLADRLGLLLHTRVIEVEDFAGAAIAVGDIEEEYARPMG